MAWYHGMVLGFMCGAGFVGLLGANMGSGPEPLRLLGSLLMQWGALMFIVTAASLLLALLVQRVRG